LRGTFLFIDLFFFDDKSFLVDVRESKEASTGLVFWVLHCKKGGYIEFIGKKLLEIELECLAFQLKVELELLKSGHGV